MNNAILDSPEQIADFFHGIEEDFAAIDYRPELRVELDAMADMESGYFGAQAGPDGNAWTPDAPATIKRKKHAIILIDTGDLSVSLGDRGTPPNSIREVVDQTNGAAAILGTYVPYSIYHTAERDGREHIGMTEVYVDAATNRVVDYSLAQLAKGA